MSDPVRAGEAPVDLDTIRLGLWQHPAPALRVIQSLIAEVERGRASSRSPEVTTDSSHVAAVITRLMPFVRHLDAEACISAGSGECECGATKAMEDAKTVAVALASCSLETETPNAKWLASRASAPTAEQPLDPAAAVCIMIRDEMKHAENYERPDSGVLRFRILPARLNILLQAIEARAALSSPCPAHKVSE